MCLVPKGTNVLVQSFTNHRREDLWGADASEWKPERWKVRRRPRPAKPSAQGPRPSQRGDHLKALRRRAHARAPRGEGV